MATTALPLASRRRLRQWAVDEGGDARLIAQVRAGDPAAFEVVYERHAAKLLAFCRHMLGNQQEAEDALQQVFVSAYDGLRRSREAIELKPWLYTIARNRCLSVLRARRDHASGGDDALEGLPGSDGLAAQVQRRADLQDLVGDIQRLPEDQRAALILFELEDRRHDEIAQVLGVKRDKVKALVFQAREGLQRAKRAREASCTTIREELAILTGVLPARSQARAHLDHCPSCTAYASDVRRQRAALALVLPVVPSAGLKTAVLGSIFLAAAAWPPRVPERAAVAPSRPASAAAARPRAARPPRAGAPQPAARRQAAQRRAARPPRAGSPPRVAPPRRPARARPPVPAWPQRARAPAQWLAQVRPRARARSRPAWARSAARASSRRSSRSAPSPPAAPSASWPPSSTSPRARRPPRSSPPHRRPGRWPHPPRCRRTSRPR